MSNAHLSRRQALASLLAVSAVASPVAAFAQSGAAYPTKPITWLVGWPAGGSVDSVTRLVAKRLEQALGQPVVVENRPGASGGIALQVAAKAPSDGYTIVTVPGPILTAQPMPQIGKELTGVAMLAKGSLVLEGTMAAPMPPTLRDLLADAGKRPDAYSFASSGNGTGQHLVGELIRQRARVEITHIPYKGGGQAVLDLVSGHIPLAVLGLTPVLPYLKSGKLRAYGVTTAARAEALPDVPTLAEAGLAGFDASQWFAVAAPSGTDAARVQKLNAAISEALKTSEVKAGFAAVGIAPEAASPQRTATFVTTDLARWRDLAQRSRLPLE